MKSKSFYRINALIMAFMLFITSFGFSIDIHYCTGQMKSISLLGKAESCHAKKNSCPNHIKMQLDKEQKSNCCSNETFQVENLDEDFNLPMLSEMTDLQFKFAFSFVYSFYSKTSHRVVYSSFLDKQYLWPPKDIYVLLERFLI